MKLNRWAPFIACNNKELAFRLSVILRIPPPQPYINYIFGALVTNIYKTRAYWHFYVILESFGSILLCIDEILCISTMTVWHNTLRSPYNRPWRAQRGSRGIALLILNLGTRRGWVVSTTPRPLYPREILGTHCTGGWVGPRAGLDVCEKYRPHRDSISGPSSP
jgi:hypothetical protein